MDNKYKFAVTIPSKEQDPNGFYKKGIMDIIVNKYPKLTVAGLDSPDVKHGVQYAGPGNLLTFGTAKTHDVEWIRRPNYAREKGYMPIYDLAKDWNTVTSRIDLFAKEKARLANEARTYNSYRNNGLYDLNWNTFDIDGIKVQVFDNFIKVGYTTIPRVATPKTFNFYSVSEIKAIEYLLVAIKRLY